MKAILRSEQDTCTFAQSLYRNTKSGCLVFLSGHLGVGKTTLVRGFLRAAGYQGAVKSPTYTLVEEYGLNDRRLFHFDLYRLADPGELEWIGFREYLSQDAICFIEWPERGGERLPLPDIQFRLTMEGSVRILECGAKTGRGQEIVRAIQENRRKK